jgi:hypothetical protein
MLLVQPTHDLPAARTRMDLGPSLDNSLLMRRYGSMGMLLYLACGGGDGKPGDGGGAALDSGGPPGAAGEIPLKMMPEAAASALCAKIAACCSAEERMQSVLPQDRAGCEMLLAAEHQSDAERIEKLTAGGRATYDGAAFAACLKTIGEQSCAQARLVNSQSAAASCPQMIAGKVAIGGDCRESAECSGGYCTGATAQAPGKCTGPRKKVGAACEDSGECETRNCDFFGGQCAPPEPERLCE